MKFGTRISFDCQLYTPPERQQRNTCPKYCCALKGTTGRREQEGKQASTQSNKTTTTQHTFQPPAVDPQQEGRRSRGPRAQLGWQETSCRRHQSPKAECTCTEGANRTSTCSRGLLSSVLSARSSEAMKRSIPRSVNRCPSGTPPPLQTFLTRMLSLQNAAGARNASIPAVPTAPCKKVLVAVCIRCCCVSMLIQGREDNGIGGISCSGTLVGLLYRRRLAAIARRGWGGFGDGVFGCVVGIEGGERAEKSWSV